MPGIINASFYVCNTPFVLIGCDILQKHVPKLSLETGTDVFKIGTIVLWTKTNDKDSLKELKRRKGLGPTNNVRETQFFISSLAWMRSCRRVNIPANSSVNVTCFIDSEWNLTHFHSFMSFDVLDWDQNMDLHVQSENYDEFQIKYRILCI